MTEQLLNMMRQWLEQLEQQQDGTDPSRYRQTPEPNAKPEGMPPLQANLLHRLTRQSEEFNRFATDLLQQCDEDKTADLQQLLDSFHQHLDQLNLDWVLYSWPLPEQLASALNLLIRQDSPATTGLTQLTELLQQLLGTLEPHLLPSLLLQFRTSLQLMETFEHARAQYLVQLGQINSEALQAFRQQLTNSTIDDLEQLHRRWIQCYEQSYQHRLGQQEYLHAFGALCNAAMALRQDWQQQLEQIYARCGLVTLSQYDELSRQHHELRRRVRNLERLQGTPQNSPPLQPRDPHDAHKG